MKNLIASLFLIILSFSLQQESLISPANQMPYLRYLPQSYLAQPTNTYPAVIFLHGSGERVNSTANRGTTNELYRIYRWGPSRWVKAGYNMSFEVNNKTNEFIVLSPQTFRWNWSPSEVIAFTDQAIADYRIDTNRILLTGISMGGRGTWDALYSNLNVPNRYAAGVVASGSASGGSFDKMESIAENHIGMWIHHGGNDFNAYHPLDRAAAAYTNLLSFNPNPAPIFTIYPGVGHSGWERVYKPTHDYHKTNIYEWFLNLDRSHAGPTPSPTPPPPPAPPVSEDINETNTFVHQDTSVEISFPNPVSISRTEEIMFSSDDELSGELIIQTAGGETVWYKDISSPWDFKNMSGQKVFPGIYLWIYFERGLPAKSGKLLVLN